MPNLVPITRERHASKRWRRYSSYAFATGVNTVPIVAAELPKAVTVFPVGFIKHGEQFVPVAILGVEPNRNLFVAPDGRWLGSYVPAALRGYPFALGRMPDGQQVLCVDEESGLLTDGPDGEAFFEEGGERPSEAVRQLLDFLVKVDQNRNATTAAPAALQAADVIEPWPIVLKGPNGDVNLAGLFRVNASRLTALDDAAFLRLRKVDAVAIAYAQLISMENFHVLSRLAALHAQRAAAPTQPAQPEMKLGQDLDLSFLESGGTLKLG